MSTSLSLHTSAHRVDDQQHLLDGDAAPHSAGGRRTIKQRLPGNAEQGKRPVLRRFVGADSAHQHRYRFLGSGCWVRRCGQAPRCRRVTWATTELSAGRADEAQHQLGNPVRLVELQEVPGVFDKSAVMQPSSRPCK